MDKQTTETEAKSAFQIYIENLNSKQLVNYAKLAGTSVGYIKTQLIYKNRIPRKALIEQLIEASSGDLSREDVLNHFYQAA